MTAPAPAAEQPDASIDVGVVLGALMRRAVRIVFVTLLLCAATYAVLMFVPRMYESSAGLLVEPRSNVFTRAANDVAGTGYVVDDATISSQIALIKSRDTVLAVIEAAGLRSVPEFSQSGGGLLALVGLGGQRSPSDARIVAAVNENLIVSQERNSRIISVAFRSQDPELAARVANAVAITHVSRRAGQQVSDTIEATAWLEGEIASLRARVAEAERRVAEFRVANDLFMGANNTSLIDQQLSSFSSQIAAATERRNAAESRAQLIRSLLQSGQSVSGVSDVQSSPVVQQLSQEKARLQGERAQQSATLLSNHPTIRALDAQIAEIDTQIAAEGRRVADALDVQARIEADLERSLQEELTRLKITAGSATREGVTLAELEREATAQRELLNAYLIRYSDAAARTESSSALPDVRIISEAAPAITPVSPKTALILVAVFLVSVILQVGAVIFGELLSGRALRAPATREPDIETVREAIAEALEDEPAEDDSFVEPPLDEDAAIDELETVEPLEDDVAFSEPDAEELLPLEPPPLRNAMPRGSALDMAIDTIAASVMTGSERRVMIAALDDWTDSQAFAERLGALVIGNGQSLAEIDAASRQQGLELGLADLVAGEADFGDVVHRGSEERFAFVPWGQSATLARGGDRITTLVDALGDIYEAVIVVTGKVGMSSTLPLFAEVGGCCVLLAEDPLRAEAAKADIEALGFAPVHVVAAASLQSEVA